jgi:hypothetical protein
MLGKRTIDDSEMLRVAAQVLAAHGLEGWLVGGSVRDRGLGYAAPDLDLVVDGDAAAVAADIARALNAPWFALSERHRAFRVVGRQGHVDVAAARGGGILEDLAQRDFTVNAMAVPVSGGDLIDPFGGLADLRSRRLVAVSDHVFSDDPLRLMRAPRFCHVLGLMLEPGLWRSVREQAPELLRAAPERVAAEIVMTLSAGRAGEAARLWNDLGLLSVIVPEVMDGDDLERIFALLDGLEALLADPLGWFADGGSALEERLHTRVDGMVDRPVGLRLAGLLSGLAPSQAAAVGRRLRFSGAMLSLLEAAAKTSRHGGGRLDLPAVGVSGAGDPARPSHGSGGPGRSAVLFLWEAAPWEPEMVLLAAARVAAENGGSAGRAAPALERASALMALWAERRMSGAPRLPFDGVDLMKELRLPPGPELGKALRAARLAWEGGEAATAAQALVVAREALRTG